VQTKNQLLGLISRRRFMKTAAAVCVFAVLGNATPNSPARDFELLVVGDSLIFGQGLLEKDKIYTHVAEWLRTSSPGAARHR
jgi:hypothetical protein